MAGSTIPTEESGAADPEETIDSEFSNYVHHILTTGRVPERPITSVEINADGTVEYTMAPGPLTSDSEESDDSTSTIARDVRDNMEIIMWNSLTFTQTSPLVLNQLHRAGIILQTNDGPRNNTTTVLRDQLLTMALTPRIPLDNFVPNLATNDKNNYLWFTWLTCAQYGEYVLNGTVPGHKDTR
eukprot:3630095-Amphidinium_carterae.1